MSKIAFPDGFVWGAATSAYQIEGAYNKDGKGESIWDTFVRESGRVKNGETGDVACDHYHLYKEDVKLMKEIGLKGYRFSVSWPRIFPGEKINSKGVEFYDNLINELLANRIEPMVTLYHWDLPQSLQDIGGWENRKVVDAYVEYARFMFEHFGDRVKKWITFNEPLVTSYIGYGFGLHAPGISDWSKAVQVSHHLNLAHAKAVERFRNLNVKNAEIGITLNLAPVYPASDSIDDQRKATIADGLMNRWFLDPVLKGNYPEDILPILKEKLHSPKIEGGDLDTLRKSSIDFLGVNYYSRAVVKWVPGEELFDTRSMLRLEKKEGVEYTEMGWEVYPEGLYDLLTRLDRDYNHPSIYVTENGAAYKDTEMINGIVQDEDRLSYLKRHFEQARKAIDAGVRLGGYYVWSLMDNFEWAEGYDKRFGLVRIDYETLKRTLKKSAYWYHQVIAENGFETDNR